MNKDLAAHFLDTSIKDFLKNKTLADKTLSRLQDAHFHIAPNGDSNSMATIIKHVSGNMISRWTDFLTTDGEKPNRMRDTEFEEKNESKDELLQRWEAGWKVLFDTMYSLTPDDLLATVHIRREPHTVMEAIIRQISHYSYHVGQMNYLGKVILGDGWESLSIPKGKSDEYLAGKINP